MQFKINPIDVLTEMERRNSTKQEVNLMFMSIAIALACGKDRIEITPDILAQVAKHTIETARVGDAMVIEIKPRA